MKCMKKRLFILLLGFLLIFTSVPTIIYYDTKNKFSSSTDTLRTVKGIVSYKDLSNGDR